MKQYNFYHVVAGHTIYQCLKYIQREGKEKRLWIYHKKGGIYICTNQMLKVSKRLSNYTYSSSTYSSHEFMHLSLSHIQ